MSRLVRWLAVAAVAAFAIVALWSAASRPAPASPEETAREISQSLRCPACAGESIADSNALLSDAMRQTVEEQVAQGRSPDEIRAWFAERYGDEVLLEPPRRGYGWLLWLLPLGMVGATVVVLLRRPRTPHRRLGAALATMTVAAIAGLWTIGSADGPRSPIAEPSSPIAEPSSPIAEPSGPLAGSEADGYAPAAGHADAADTVAVLRGAVEDAPGDAERRLALAAALERDGDTDGAVAEYAAVVRLEPLDPDIRYRYAFALVRDGEADAAVDVLDETLSFDDAHAPTLLLLGSLLQEEQPQRAAELLRRFVQREPEHPATEQITELLGDRPTVAEETP